MKRIYSKESVCIGCGLCRIHCAVQHSESRDILKAYRKERESLLPRLSVEESGALSFGMQCRQCEEPLCVYSCLSGAMSMREDGIVTCDESRCIGCWTCVLACPYGAIQRSKSGRSTAAKCDMCPHLDTPACVANCPNGALVLEETTG